MVAGADVVGRPGAGRRQAGGLRRGHGTVDEQSVRGRDRPQGAPPADPGPRRRRLPQDHSRVLGRAEGRHRRRSGPAWHGRIAPGRAARRPADLRRLRRTHGSPDGLRVPGGLRPDHRAQGTADRAVRRGHVGGRGVVRARADARGRAGGRDVERARPSGAFGRNDEMADVRAAVPNFYVQGSATRSHTDDYEDGSGAAVHSFYTRWSVNGAFGWTPDRDTRLEVSGGQEQRPGRVRRPDDGRVEFARDNVAITFDRRFTSSVLQRIEVQSYYNYIDHVMDNFSLRTPGMTYSAMNPDRPTMGGRGTMTLAVKTVDERRGGRRRAAQRPHGPQRDGRQVGGRGHRRVHVGAARGGHALHADRVVRRSHPRPHASGAGWSAALRVDWHEALDSRACVAAIDVSRRVAAQERHPRGHRPQDAAQRVRPLRARPRRGRPVGTLLRRRRARRAVPGLLGADQAGSGHAQQRVPVDQARTDDPARRRRGLDGWRVVGVGVGLRQHDPRLHPDSLGADAHADAQRGRDDSGRRSDRRVRHRPEPEGRRDGGLRPRRQHDGRQAARPAAANGRPPRPHLRQPGVLARRAGAAGGRRRTAWTSARATS